MKLIIEKADRASQGKKLTGSHYNYYLDGDGTRMDITKSLTRLRLNMGPSEANRTILDLRLDDVVADVDALVELIGKMEEKGEGVTELPCPYVADFGPPCVLGVDHVGPHRIEVEEESS
jgi:hypothetical protein